MAQTTQLIGTLKATLKSRGLTYRNVAGALELSEAKVEAILPLAVIDKTNAPGLASPHLCCHQTSPRALIDTKLSSDN